MAIADILAKCGMSAEDVKRIAEKHMKPSNGLSVAEENERKYAGVELEEARWEKTHGDVYREIRAGADNGGCTTRKGTYRRLKTGDGRCATMEDLRIRREIDERQRKRRQGGSNDV